jgi:hypothetical protein
MTSIVTPPLPRTLAKLPLLDAPCTARERITGLYTRSAYDEIGRVETLSYNHLKVPMDDENVHN